MTVIPMQSFQSVREYFHTRMIKFTKRVRIGHSEQSEESRLDRSGFRSVELRCLAEPVLRACEFIPWLAPRLVL
jgi:hypothetical protein